MKQHDEAGTKHETKTVVKEGKTLLSVGKLRTWQLFIAAVLTLHVLILILMSAGSRVPVYLQYLATDTLQSKVTGTPTAGPAVHELLGIQVTSVVAALLLGTAAGLVLLATKWRGRYEQWLAQGWQPTRYLIGAYVLGLTLVGVALVGGMRDLVALKLTAVLIAVGAALLYEAERQRVSAKQNLGLIFGIGVATLVLAWLATLETLVASAGFGGTGQVYLWWLTGTVFAGWLVVAINEVLSRHGYRLWANYLFSEAVWLVVIAVLNIAFAWQLYAGLLKP